MMTVLRCVAAARGLVKVERRLTGRYLWLLGVCSLLVAGVWYGVRGVRAGQAATGETEAVAPRSLASADCSGDGVVDVVSGYALSDGTGRVTLQRGRAESRGVGEKGSAGDIAPFSVAVKVIAAPLSLDFLGAGDFNADDHADLVLGTRGGSKLVWWSGDGRGGLTTAGESELPGALTALAVGELNRPDGLPEVVIGLAKPDGAGQATAEVFAVSAPVSGLALGQLDSDFMPDLAVGAARVGVAARTGPEIVAQTA